MGSEGTPKRVESREKSAVEWLSLSRREISKLNAKRESGRSK